MTHLEFSCIYIRNYNLILKEKDMSNGQPFQEERLKMLERQVLTQIEQCTADICEAYDLKSFPEDYEDTMDH